MLREGTEIPLPLPAGPGKPPAGPKIAQTPEALMALGQLTSMALAQLADGLALTPPILSCTMNLPAPLAGALAGGIPTGLSDAKGGQIVKPRAFPRAVLITAALAPELPAGEVTNGT